MTPDGSIARFWENGFDRVRSRADHRSQPIQRSVVGRQYPGEVIVTAVRWYLRYPLAYEHVSELLTERGPPGRCQLHLALGTSVRTGVEQALSAALEASQQELPHRRNLYQGKGSREVSLSSRRFHRADHRFPAHGQTQCGCSEALLSQGI
jgi:hypothetical protein